MVFALHPTALTYSYICTPLIKIFKLSRERKKSIEIYVFLKAMLTCLVDISMHKKNLFWGSTLSFFQDQLIAAKKLVVGVTITDRFRKKRKIKGGGKFLG